MKKHNSHLANKYQPFISILISILWKKKEHSVAQIYNYLFVLRNEIYGLNYKIWELHNQPSLLLNY